jgi:hypothetical protein
VSGEGKKYEQHDSDIIIIKTRSTPNGSKSGFYTIGGSGHSPSSIIAEGHAISYHHGK